MITDQDFETRLSMIEDTTTELFFDLKAQNQRQTETIRTLLIKVHDLNDQIKRLQKELASIPETKEERGMKCYETFLKKYGLTFGTRDSNS